MSEDTIKRSDAIKALCKLGHEVVVIDKVCSLGVATEFIDAIRALPSADRPQGEWIDNGDRYFRCSLCGAKDTDKWLWCHGCGVKMKGVSDAV